jgi:hypothetical protein
MNALDADTWSTDWAWSLPLMLLNVIIHVLGLVFINDAVIHMRRDVGARHRFVTKFAAMICAAVLLIIVLHALEAGTWAAAYRLLGALPDNKSAMLYSLGAMTSYGHANLFLLPHWQMMGVLQSLTGVLLFGLSTAFMYAMIQALWQPRAIRLDAA